MNNLFIPFPVYYKSKFFRLNQQILVITTRVRLITFVFSSNQGRQMFYVKINKKIAFLVFLILSLIGVWLVLDFIQIGPGLPPSESMPKWYIPEAWQGNVQRCISSFPKVSPYCKVGKYSDGKFINVWYFDDEL